MTLLPPAAPGPADGSAYRYRDSERNEYAFLLELLNGLLMLGAVWGAYRADVSMRRLAFLFVAGVAGLGFLLRLRRLTWPRVRRLDVDAGGLSWSDGAGLEGRVAWEEMRRVIVLARETRAIRIERLDGAPERLPADCIPDNPLEVADAVREHLPASLRERVALYVEAPGPS